MILVVLQLVVARHVLLHHILIDVLMCTSLYLNVPPRLQRRCTLGSSL